MNEEKFFFVKKEFNNFCKTLSQNIKNTYTSYLYDCSFVEETWYNGLIESFNKYDNLKKENKIDKDFDYINLLPEYDSKTINEFSYILKQLKENKKLKLINRKLLELIYNEDLLENEKYIKYYSGNNKLIIEYKKNISNKALLIIDPLNLLKENIFIISFEHDEEEKLSLFKDILSNENLELKLKGKKDPNNNDIPELILIKENNISKNNLEKEIKELKEQNRKILSHITNTKKMDELINELKNFKKDNDFIKNSIENIKSESNSFKEKFTNIENIFKNNNETNEENIKNILQEKEKEMKLIIEIKEKLNEINSNKINEINANKKDKENIENIKNEFNNLKKIILEIQNEIKDIKDEKVKIDQIINDKNKIDSKKEDINKILKEVLENEKEIKEKITLLENKDKIFENEKKEIQKSIEENKIINQKNNDLNNKILEKSKSIEDVYNKLVNLFNDNKNNYMKNSSLLQAEKVQKNNNYKNNITDNYNNNYNNNNNNNNNNINSNNNNNSISKHKFSKFKYITDRVG